MSADTFFMYVEKYARAVPIIIIAIVFLLIFYYIVRHHIYTLIKQVKIERKKKIQERDYKLKLDFGINSIIYLIPLSITLFIVLNPKFIAFFSNFYQRNIENHVVLGLGLFLLVLLSPFVYLWIKFSIVMIYRQIHGFIAYTFLSFWFLGKKKKYTKEEYKVFLKKCISWSEKELPNLTKLSKKRYNSPISMISYFNAKLFVKRSNTFRDFARNELRKLQ